MGRDDVVNIHTATSLSHQKGWNEAINNDVGEVERTYAKWTQSVIERQITNTIQLHSHVNFKKPDKLAKGQRGGWEKQTKKHTLNHRESTNKYQRKVREMGNQGMGIVEVTSDQNQALDSRVESLCVNLKLHHTVFIKRNSNKSLK